MSPSVLNNVIIFVSVHFVTQVRHSAPSRKACEQPYHRSYTSNDHGRGRIEHLSSQVDPESGRPVDIELVAQGNEVIAQNVEDARLELGIDATDADVSLRAVDSSIQNARELAQTDPEKAGAILTASNVEVRRAQSMAPPVLAAQAQRLPERLPKYMYRTVVPYGPTSTVRVLMILH